MRKRAELVSARFLVALAVAGCAPDSPLPEPGSEAYHEFVSVFYAGLAAMEAGAEAHAEMELRRATELASGEPAAWANLGLLALRRNEFDAAGERLERAAALAPENSSIQVYLGLLDSNRGRLLEAIAHMRRAVELDSTNVRAMYALAQELERRGTEGDAAEIESWLDRILAAQPGNMAVLMETARIAARREDTETLEGIVARLGELSSGWPAEAGEQLATLKEAVASADFRRAATRVAFLRNILLTDQAYRDDLASVQTPLQQVGEPIEGFLRLPIPSAMLARADDSLRFSVELLLPEDTNTWSWISAPTLGLDEPPTVVVGDGRELRTRAGLSLPFPGGPSAEPPSSDGIAWLDLDNDFRTDLAMAGAGGFRLYRQGDDGWLDVTDVTGLSSAVSGIRYSAVWSADFDLEGDLDLLLAAPGRALQALRNNGDGTFSPIGLFDSPIEPVAFAWADLDGDGDPDAAFIDGSDSLTVFENRRQGVFAALPTPNAGPTAALATADVNNDGVIDLIALAADRTVVRLSTEPEARSWTVERLAQWPSAVDEEPDRILLADLDNNGGLDLIISGADIARIWLRTDTDGYQLLPTSIEARPFMPAPLEQGGRLDLVGLSTTGQPVTMVNRGTSSYGWARLRPRAAESAGDQRINSFGIGGVIELRSGLLYQKQTIAGPLVHFGLGENPVASVARIIWPNGSVQAEFDLAAGSTILATQRLKGSCPWVFTYDGEGMRFVTDFLWRSPLGLRINAQETAGVMMTEDWIKIRGDQLVPRDGYYDVRITAELWETHFFDHVSLMVVDHPANTEIFVDERFAFPPPPLEVQLTDALRAVAGAWDDLGGDVTEILRARDELYLDTFERGRYQGVARSHFVELELGDGVPSSGPLWLIATGWVRPTDSSINVALSQGRHAPPRGLQLEVPDGSGGWSVVRKDLGFPAGKSKTVLIDLEEVFKPGTPRRLRLRTNLEIYWDRIAWAQGLPTNAITTQRVAPESAQLRYRGFSEVSEADRSAPEYPSYEKLASTMPYWRDLIGFHTRFGDVRELLSAIDDRYVIMNAGDEMAFRFLAPPPPPKGWVRDFVLIGDGWVKDGDYNTTFSETVRPLPRHDEPNYTTPPGRLQDDPAFRRHSEDWGTYHTRYVTPERFRAALIPKLEER